MSFSDCEALIKKHAPLMMRVGAPLRFYASPRVAGVWRGPIKPATVKKMKRIRASGLTIGEVARGCRVSWRTVWFHTRKK